MKTRKTLQGSGSLSPKIGSAPAAESKQIPKVFMMDLLAIVPYYTAYLSRALIAEGASVTVGSISYYLDPGCFLKRGIYLDPGALDIVSRFHLPRMLRRILKLAESVLNMATLAFRFRIAPPAIIHVQYLPLLQWPFPLDAWFIFYCRRLGSKTVLTVHDLLSRDARQKQKQVILKLYSEVDAIICHSDHVKIRLSEDFPLPAEKIRVIPHGPFFYDLPDHAPAQPLHLEPGETIVLWQGIILPYKGLDVLLDAWSSVEVELPHARLVIVGTGAPHLLHQIREQIATLGLERVTLLFRFASTEELVAIYRAAAIVVYPYREITTSGALATGLALGKAIVASDLPVFRELLTSGEDALLVEPESPRLLAAAISVLLQNEAMRQRFIAAVIARDFGDRSWISIAMQTMRVYDAVLTPR